MKEEQQQHQEGRGFPGTVSLIVTALTHVLLLAPVIYIVALYIEHYQFFSWHPICMSVGVGLIMMEAIFGISGEANLTCRVSRANRVTLHWTLHATGMSLMIIGLIITIVNKNRIGKEHFVTPHAKLGLSAIILAILVGMFGILANNTRWLYPRIRPVLVKVGHAIGGIAIAILLLATVINGTYRPSFPGSETGTSLVFSSLFFAGLLVFAKPIVGAVSRSRVIFNSPKPNTTRST